MKRIFSGIQPTGEIHLGNYVGAIRNWVYLQEEYDCIFSVVDYHAITIEYPIEEMARRTLETGLILLACGLSPEKSKIFVQSHVPEHTELAWIFNTVTPIGEVERMTQFKDKAKQHRANINMGLMDYPVLQSADILLYKAGYVPVGEDQVQHIELSREVARKFNSRFGAGLSRARGDTFNGPAHPRRRRPGEDVKVARQLYRRPRRGGQCLGKAPYRRNRREPRAQKRPGRSRNMQYLHDPPRIFG